MKPIKSVKLVIMVTGASGAIHARRALSLLSAEVAKGRALEVHWVASTTAPQVWRAELGEDLPDTIEHLRRWDRLDYRAPFASGSNAPDAVIVMPCSMSTLARVAHGGGDDLIARACEVALKERRRLILVVRETPLSLVHLRNMVAATEAGAIILPAVPSFYAGIQTLEQAVDTVVGRALDRALDQAGVTLNLLPRWGTNLGPT
jgi:polyprenyl P-hydroxybenzoate/phenylacrylic acid decarboxylase-like protein